MPRQPKQQDAAAAIAAARAALKPSVDAGVFSDDPPKRLSKFLLKFAMTSLENHQESSWDEAAFQYDDARARPVIAKAAAGDAEADAMLCEIARARLSKGLPPNLAGYVGGVLGGQSGPNPGGRPLKFFDRDLCIYYAVERIRVDGGRVNFKPTRNDASKSQESASSVVAKALKELGITMSEKDVGRIWLKIFRSTPAGSVPNK